MPYPKAKQRERGRREKHTYTHITPLHSVSDGKKNQQLFRNGFEPSRDAEKKTIRHEKRGRQSEKCVTNGRTKKEFIPKAYYIITNIEMYVTYIQYTIVYFTYYMRPLLPFSFVCILSFCPFLSLLLFIPEIFVRGVSVVSFSTSMDDS